MKEIIPKLLLRNERMKLVRLYFFKRKVSSHAKKNFIIVIKEGERLVTRIKKTWIYTSMRNDIENWMLACEEVILAIAIEDRTESCMLIDLIDDLKYERHLVSDSLAKLLYL
jgi:hypothetical protein